MKIVVLDGYTENPGDLSWDGLAAYGDLTVYDRTPPDEIAARMHDAEIVLTNKTPISRQTLAACPHVRYIGVLATGYNVVDIQAAKERGVPVCNVPTYGTAAVGQFAIALLLEICHHIGAHSESVHKGDWENSADWCYWNYPLIELAGKTMGIIGYGRIGQATGRIAQAMGMNVIAVDAFHHQSLEGPTMHYVELDELLAQADVISLHCPLLESTQGIICKKNIDKMKDGVIIINNSRGPLIVEADLADALRAGKVYAAGVDVASTEPIERDNPLLSAPNCLITPHISWASRESRQRLMDIAVKNVAQFIAGAPVNVVNL